MWQLSNLLWNMKNLRNVSKICLVRFGFQTIPNYKKCQHAHAKTKVLNIYEKSTNIRILRKRNEYLRSPYYNFTKTKIKKIPKIVSKC